VLTNGNKEKKTTGRKKRFMSDFHGADELKPQEEPRAEEEEILPGNSEVMSVDDIMVGEDCSRATAVKIHAGMEALARERSFREFAKRRKDGAHYLCTATRSTGYWRIGRHFGTGQTVVFRDELTELQIAELEATDPLHMKVERIGIDKTSTPAKTDPSEDITQPIDARG